MTPRKKTKPINHILQTFGFEPLEALYAMPELRKPKKRLKSVEGEKNATLRYIYSIAEQAYMRDFHMEEQPRMFFDIKTKNQTDVEISLTTLCIPSGFAEAISLLCAYSLLNACGRTDLYMRINSKGDAVSQEKFIRMFNRFVKINKDKIPKKYLALSRKNMQFFYKEMERNSDIEHVAEHLPSPVENLSPHSEDHFQNVLDYIGSQSIPFDVDKFLFVLANPYCSTMMDIKSNGSEDFSVFGGRYNLYCEKTLRCSLPMTHISIHINGGASFVSKTLRKRDKKLFYMVHTGEETRKHALNILFQAVEKNICISHCLYRNRLMDQIDYGKADSFRYHIICGHQEMSEHKVLLKKTQTNFFKKIPIDHIFPRLKQIR